MSNEKLNDKDVFKLCVEYWPTKWKKSQEEIKEKKK